jgi:hypothetical protein
MEAERIYIILGAFSRLLAGISGTAWGKCVSMFASLRQLGTKANSFEHIEEDAGLLVPGGGVEPPRGVNLGGF